MSRFYYFSTSSYRTEDACHRERAGHSTNRLRLANNLDEIYLVENLLQMNIKESVMNHEYPMRSDLKVGAKFPDFELPDHTGSIKKLSQLLRNMPGVIVFNRGYF